MKKVLIIGGGLAGSIAADELSKKGQGSIILEKGYGIGGKVRKYSCKADENCTNCGVCLVKNLFKRIENDDNIEIITNSKLKDLYGNKGDFTAIISKGKETIMLSSLSDIIVASGFADTNSLEYYGLMMPINSKIVRGQDIEELILKRDSEKIFEKELQNIAFIQCFGSRDIGNKSNYCSKVCCGYSQRAARVVRKYYPNLNIDILYIDIQQVERGNYIKLLEDKNINLIRSRPSIIKNGKNPVLRYEDVNGENVSKEYDLIVLSDGIKANPDNEYLAEITGLRINKNGFLSEVETPSLTGVYMTGCVSGPMGIKETHTMSVSVASKIINNIENGQV